MVHCKERFEGLRQRAKMVLNWAIIYQLKAAAIKKLVHHSGYSGFPLSPRFLDLLDEEVCITVCLLYCGYCYCMLLCYNIKMLLTSSHLIGINYLHAEQGASNYLYMYPCVVVCKCIRPEWGGGWWGPTGEGLGATHVTPTGSPMLPSPHMGWPLRRPLPPQSRSG